MSSKPKKSPAEELLDSLLKDVGTSAGSPSESLFGSLGDEKKTDKTQFTQANQTEVLGTLIHKDNDETMQGFVSFESLAEDGDAKENQDVTDMDDLRFQKTVVATRPIANNEKTSIAPAETFVAKTEIMYDATNAGQENHSESSPESMDDLLNQFNSKNKAVENGLASSLFGSNSAVSTESELDSLQRSDEVLSEQQDYLVGQLEPSEAEGASASSHANPVSLFGDESKNEDLDLQPPVSLFDSPQAVSTVESKPVNFKVSPENIQKNVALSDQTQPVQIAGSDQAIAADKTRVLGQNSAIFKVNPELTQNTQATVPMHRVGQFSQVSQVSQVGGSSTENGERTIAVTGFQIKPEENLDEKVKVSVGRQSRSSGFSSWGGGVEGNLNQAESLKMAQEKILELEKENERIRRQNEELIAASEIIKERSDLLTSQLTEFKNDRDGLEQSFKNEMTLLKNHLARKDNELKKAQFKVDELESKLKFDMKKIRVRERELENRLELVRAEKNAISKNKDEQILDLRRRIDMLQMEVDSYRQKCVELNKQIEQSQDSFKRTTRALRLAMANLELQEENKTPLKKAE